MITKKAGTVLINIESKKIALVDRNDFKGLEFPKGHLEEGETLQQCAIRETEEETQRKNHLFEEKELNRVRYVTSKGEDVELYIYLSIDDGPTEKNIKEHDKEEWIWVDFDKVEESLVFQNLIDFWKESKDIIKEKLSI